MAVSPGLSDTGTEATGGYWSGGVFYPEATFSEPPLWGGTLSAKGEWLLVVSYGGDTPTDSQGNTYEEILTEGQLRVWKCRITSPLEATVDTIEITNSYAFYVATFSHVDLDDPVEDTWSDSITQTGPTDPAVDVSGTITAISYYSARVYLAASKMTPARQAFTAYPGTAVWCYLDGDEVNETFYSKAHYETASEMTNGNINVQMHVEESPVIGDVGFTFTILPENPIYYYDTIVGDCAVLLLKGRWGSLVRQCFTPGKKLVLKGEVLDGSHDHTLYHYDLQNNLLSSNTTPMLRGQQELKRLRSGQLLGFSAVSRDGGFTWSNRGSSPPNDPVQVPYVQSVDFDPSTGFTLFAAQDSYLTTEDIYGRILCFLRRNGFSFSGSGWDVSYPITSIGAAGYCVEVRRRPNGWWDLLYTESYSGTTYVKLRRLKKVHYSGGASQTDDWGDEGDIMFRMFPSGYFPEEYFQEGYFNQGDTNVVTIATGYQMATSAYDPTTQSLVIALWKVTENKWYVTHTDLNLSSIPTPTLLCSNATRSGEMHRRPDGVWEFVYVTTSDTIQWLTCRNLQPGSNGTWA